MLNPPVAVGVTDGQNLDVIGFALGEAARLGSPLRIIHVVEDPAERGAWPDGIDRLLKDVTGDVPVVRVTTSGDAATLLLAESRTAWCLALGADDPALTPAHWSEVAQQVALHATIPVVVVPMARAAGPHAGHVLVAVDEAHAADGQLAYGLEAARQRGTDLDVVFGAGVTSDYPGRQVHMSRLEDIVDRWRPLHPSTSIRVSVEGGHPVESCIAAAQHASLLVVGRPQGKHPRIGSRSVASRILRGSPVPVAVVPLDYTPTERRVTAELGRLLSD
jgi:nucleotide-binding universal stress UspA family protein